MTLPIFALVAGVALLKTVKFVVIKTAPDRLDDWFIGWGSRFFSVPLLATAVYLSESKLVLSTTFFVAFTAVVGLSALTTWLTMRVFRTNDLSLMSPLLTTVPLFVVVASFVLLGELPGIVGGIGILTIVAGVYGLEARRADAGWLEPLRALCRSTTIVPIAILIGGRALLLPFLKMGTQASSPLLFAFAVQVGISIVLTIPAQPTFEHFTDTAVLYPVLLGFIGATKFIMSLTALNYAVAAYVSSVKNLNILFAIFVGWYFFGEEGIQSRFAGGVLVFAGVGLILLA